MTKPIAYYDSTRVERLELGQRAIIAVTMHPNRAINGDGYILTSRVTSLQAAGVFETENTIYVPVPLLPTIL